jgi:23S rRNA pseudouridine955/2504/2580 synthase
MSAPETPPPFPVLLLDDSLVAVVKPAGLPAQGSGDGAATVETALAGWLGGRAVSHGFKLTVAHRLDKETSGVLLLVRRKRACRRVMEQFASGAVEKRYLALVLRGPSQAEGALEGVQEGVQEGMIDRPLADLAHPQAPPQPARTDYRVLARSADLALLECRPRTGRTHQLRRHLAQEGWPIAGDVRYGSARFDAHARAQWGLQRMFLHAALLQLEHPDSGERLALQAQLPEELQAVLGRAGLRTPDER